MKCHHCGATVDNGLALCELCRRYVASALEYLPVYFRNLARWKPGRAGSRPVPGSRVLYDGAVATTGTGDRIADTLDEAMTALTTWARTLSDARTFPHPLTLTDAVLRDDISDETAETLTDDQARAAALLCAGFEQHLTSVSTTDWCGDFVRDLDHHETRLRQLTEVAIPGWYAGACRRKIALDATCGAPTYVVPGLTWVTCGVCGATTHAGDHLETILDEARDWIGRPKALAEALVALLDTEPSVPRLYDRIRRWAADEAIVVVRRTTRGYTWDYDAGVMVVADELTGPARYRLGDVLALILRETTRRAEIKRNAAAAS